MELLKWIDKNLDEVKTTLLFGKYFDSINLENVEDEYYLINPNLGIDIMLTPELFLKSIHFYSGSQERVQPFVDKLPFALDFSFTQEYTRQLLGKPNEFGGRGHVLLNQKIPFWDRYEMDGFSVHLQFSDDKSNIELITIDSLKYA